MEPDDREGAPRLSRYPAAEPAPAALFTSYGPYVGRLTVKKRDGKDLRFQFEDLEEMKTAVSGLLGERLLLKVRWDDRKGSTSKRPEPVWTRPVFPGSAGASPEVGLLLE